MKLISKTKKYATVKITIQEYNLLLANKARVDNQIKYKKWFLENHIRLDWEDEYGSSHTSWKNKKTKEYAPQGSLPFGVY